MTDNVNPSHYDGDACMRAIAASMDPYPFCIGNTVKYLWRLGRKHERFEEELGKAQWYVDWLLEYADTSSYQLTSRQHSVIRALRAVIETCRVQKAHQDDMSRHVNAALRARGGVDD